MMQLIAFSQTLTFRSSVQLIAASRRTTEAPPRPSSRQGKDLGAPLAPGIDDSTAPIAAQRQSFLDNVVAQFRAVRS